MYKAVADNFTKLELHIPPTHIQGYITSSITWPSKQTIKKYSRWWTKLRIYQNFNTIKLNKKITHCFRLFWSKVSPCKAQIMIPCSLNKDKVSVYTVEISAYNACNVEVSTCNVKVSAYNVRISAWNVEVSARNKNRPRKAVAAFHRRASKCCVSLISLKIMTPGLSAYIIWNWKNRPFIHRLYLTVSPYWTALMHVFA